MTEPDIADAEWIWENALQDPMWRLTSGELYKIAPNDPVDGEDEGAGIIPFIPRKEQVAIFKALLDPGVKQLMLPKCRQPGFSTALGIFCLDSVIFRSGIQASLVDQTAGDAAKKMNRIVYVAFDNLPKLILEDITIKKKNDGHLSILYKERSASDLYAGMDPRGGTNSVLWISEWGVIQYEDAKRSTKIRTGGLPSAKKGKIVIETTWKGAAAGDVWELIEPTLTGMTNDWVIQFTGWHQNPNNVDRTSVIDETARKYFEKIGPRAKEAGITFSEDQIRWWAAEKRRQGIFMSSENPTFLDECWSSPVPGAIYAEAIDRARAEGRVTGQRLYKENKPVLTFWDLGAPLQTICWYLQFGVDVIDVINVDMDLEYQLVPRVNHMKQKGYYFAGHYLPHDEAQTMKSGLTMGAEFAAAWLMMNPTSVSGPGASIVMQRANVRHVPRTHSEEVGINQMLQLFPQLRFQSPECDKALERLALYRRPVPRPGQLLHPKPIKDWASHVADGLRTFAEAHTQRMIDFKAVAWNAGGWNYPSQWGQKRKGLSIKPRKVGG